MPPTFLKSFQVNHGTIGEASPEGVDDLYVSPEELQGLYGCPCTAQDIRAAMALINARCGRPSLFPCQFDSGEITVPPDRQEIRLPITPVIAITAAAGRYGLGRRDRAGWAHQMSSIASYLVLIGGSPQWTPIDVAQIQCDAGTGVCWLPAPLVFAPFAVVRMTFIAGMITIPDRIKLCVLELINNMHAKGVSDRTRLGVGRISRTYASDSFITKEAERLLSPFLVQSLM